MVFTQEPSIPPRETSLGAYLILYGKSVWGKGISAVDMIWAAMLFFEESNYRAALPLWGEAQDSRNVFEVVLVRVLVPSGGI